MDVLSDRLMEAIKTDDAAQVERCLAVERADPNAEVPAGYTALACAAFHGCCAAIRCLVAHKADPARHTLRGLAPLTWAISHNHREAAQTLLELRADPDAKSTLNGDTALIVAAKSDMLAETRLLLAFGASVDWRNALGCTALNFAAAKASPELCAALIAARADVDARSYFWDTGALEAALKAEAFENAALLIAALADMSGVEPLGARALADPAIRAALTARRELLAQTKSRMLDALDGALRRQMPLDVVHEIMGFWASDAELRDHVRGPGR